MLFTSLPHRGSDDFGSGEFEAPRGAYPDGSKKVHKGIDYACYPGTTIYSPIMGRITKFGFPYGDDLSFRYIEITDDRLARHRLFYVKPDDSLQLNDLVSTDDLLGESQDIAGRYTTKEKYMKGHTHYEILVKGKPVNPELYEG